MVVDPASACPLSLQGSSQRRECAEDERHSSDVAEPLTVFTPGVRLSQCTSDVSSWEVLFNCRQQPCILRLFNAVRNGSSWSSSWIHARSRCGSWRDLGAPRLASEHSLHCINKKTCCGGGGASRSWSVCLARFWPLRPSFSLILLPLSSPVP